MIKLHDMTIRLCAGVKTLQEVVDVLAPIIHVFSCRIYGSRSKKTKTLIERVSDATRDENRT
jgi:hypothetical protein